MKQRDIDRDRKKFLTSRLRQAYVLQPRLRELRKMLLKIGGEELVAPGAPDPDLEPILAAGVRFKGEVLMMPLVESQCHRNVSALWVMQKADEICTGYGLSVDGCWRSHSWARSNGRIVETTAWRQVYFGRTLSVEEADAFAAAQLGPLAHTLQMVSKHGIERSEGGKNVGR